jgi:hypothetical protein
MAKVHVVRRDDAGWAVEHEGAEGPIATYPTEELAVTAAREHARQHGDAEVVLHDADGGVRESTAPGPEGDEAAAGPAR